MTDLYDRLRQLKMKAPSKAKSFDEMPDMKVVDGRFDGFDMESFVKSGLEGIRESFENQGEKAPEMKIVGLTLHVLMLNPDDEKREQIAHTEVIAWHKDCGDIRQFAHHESENCDCDDDCKKQNNEEQPYKAGKYEGAMYG